MSSPAPIARLLVIDDDLVVCELLTHLLSNEGFNVSTRTSGEAALALLEEDPAGFDAVLTDLQMPGIGGVELASRLRAISPGAVLLGMSARAPLEDESAAAFDAFLSKPFSVSDFRSALDGASRRHGSGVPSSAAWASGAETRTIGAEPDTALPEREPSRSGAEPMSPGAEPTGQAPWPEAILTRRIYDQLRAAIGHAHLLQLYELTAYDVDSRLSRMRASLLAGDHEEVRREAHAIKGSCAMVGAGELSRLAAGIEAGSETGYEQVAELQEACLRLKQVVTIVPP